MAISLWGLTRSATSQQVDLASLWLDQVKQGDLQREIKGFGILEPKVQKLLSAQYPAVVEQILLKPGASVTAESVILKLASAEINQAKQQAQLALNEQKAQLKQLLLSQQKELLLLQTEQSDLTLDLKIAKTKLAAETKLAKTGIISQLDLMQTTAQFEKLSNRAQNAAIQLEQMQRFHRQAITLQNEKITEKQSLLTLAQERETQLSVTAGMDGILQSLSVELGQSVDQGSQLALVGGSQSLVALVQIPQREVQEIKLAMPATINTRGGIASGKVSRIEPIVTDGNVTVEIELVGPLPDNARPSLRVEATVWLSQLNNVLYIETPVNALPQSRIQLYRIDPQDNQAKLIWVELGVKSGQLVEIKGGATLNDRLILSDMGHYRKQSPLAVIE